MLRVFVLTTALAGGAVVLLPAMLSAQAARTSTRSECVSSPGAGVKSRRTFCDVLVGETPGGSVSMIVPARTGQATLRFDLHNRFDIPVVMGFPGASYARHEAVVRVVGEDATVIGRAAVVREFRTMTDLFDQLAGGGRPGGLKAVAPGAPESVRFSIPVGVTTIGIVGEHLRVRTAVGGEATFDAPGRPVAMVSNLRLEYRPR